jgi:DNA-binding IclR family transcriptional regulator
VAGSSALQSHNWVGQHIPLHATSNGKVLLCELEPEKLEESLGKLARFTPMTITRKAQLREELEVVRRQGYSVAVDELEVGLTAVAAPIRNAHGDIVASISVSGPTFRLTEERMEKVIPECVEAAAEISHRLGWGVR